MVKEFLIYSDGLIILNIDQLNLAEMWVRGQMNNIIVIICL